ncbi:MAG: tRNA1(Val) (adenine(37)-N6)-methyltransferase [Parvicellaceae bacterium]
MSKRIYKPFNFKKFSIHQNNAAMKIGTDGILIASWVNVSKKFRALDIGSGTGIITIMLCQRNLNLELDSLELSANAIMDAKINIENCNWSDRIKLFHQDLKDFHPDSNYDLIVSNPPYFKKSLQPSNSERSKARHQNDLKLEDILKFSNQNLTKDGSLNIILPFEQKKEAIEFAKKHGLNAIRECAVYPKPNKAPHRILIEFSRSENKQLIKESLVIEEAGRHNYSEDYKKLTREFYTIFE